MSDFFNGDLLTVFFCIPFCFENTGKLVSRQGMI